MFAAIRRYETNPASVKELIQRINTEFLPLVSKSPGFLAYHVVDAGKGVIASISFFETEAGAQESTTQAANWVKSISSLVPNPPQVTAGNIAVQKWR
ncbi:MAG: antibiotic biosynthesis monooxygenase [Candidatus Bathyarchaeia archaeon]